MNTFTGQLNGVTGDSSGWFGSILDTINNGIDAYKVSQTGINPSGVLPGYTPVSWTWPWSDPATVAPTTATTAKPDYQKMMLWIGVAALAVTVWTAFFARGR